MQVTTPYQRRAPTTAFGVADAHSYYLYVVNDEGSTKPLLVDVSGWSSTMSGATVLANQASLPGGQGWGWGEGWG